MQNVKLKILFKSGIEKTVGYNTQYYNTNEIVNEFLYTGKPNCEWMFTSFYNDPKSCGVIRIGDISMIEVVCW